MYVDIIPEKHIRLSNKIVCIFPNHMQQWACSRKQSTRSYENININSVSKILQCATAQVQKKCIVMQIQEYKVPLTRDVTYKNGGKTILHLTCRVAEIHDWGIQPGSFWERVTYKIIREDRLAPFYGLWVVADNWCTHNSSITIIFTV